MAEHGWNLDDGFRIERFDAQDTVSADAVIDLWTREGAVGADEARRRVGELHLVAIDDHGAPAGVSTTYLEHNAQLGMDLWYYRAFVARAHRRTVIGLRLAVAGRDDLEQRFVTGRDTRGAGVLLEVENAGLKRDADQAFWWATDFTFIGENARGDHVRVHYFRGALAPEPPAARR